MKGSLMRDDLRALDCRNRLLVSTCGLVPFTLCLERLAKQVQNRAVVKPFGVLKQVLLLRRDVFDSLRPAQVYMARNVSQGLHEHVQIFAFEALLVNYPQHPQGERQLTCLSRTCE
eukprot:CAMPEP_0119514800 /NCGR_PEP_ID=MMETSP1344-20130328/32513_1 /TAXON_ID=236787 /ORGANISM="Florenciella parvula, Strain CCMP2471" /LENGTH=115 /DNA_ID=CAMNT_0007552145 /DNA_START=536 /DNA_END=880 /DNA_ORIENTATION=+